MCSAVGVAFSGLHTVGELRLTLQEGPVVREVHHLSMNVHRTVNESRPYQTSKTPEGRSATQRVQGLVFFLIFS